MILEMKNVGVWLKLYPVSSQTCRLLSTKVLKSGNATNPLFKPDRPPRKPRYDDKKWKEETIAVLEKNLKKEAKELAQLYHLHAAQTQAVRYTVENDWSSLLSFLHTRLHTRSTGFKDREANEIFSVSLLAVRKNLIRILEKDGDNASEASALCFSLGNIVNKLHMDPDTRAVSILLLDTLTEWVSRRSVDGDSDEIAYVIHSYKRKISKDISQFDISKCHLYYPIEERDAIDFFLTELGKNNYHQELEDFGYPENMTIVDSLRQPASTSDYHGNPFQVDEVSKETLRSLFDENIRNENANWLPVRNFEPNARKPGDHNYAEGLIEKWGWKTNITQSIARLEKKRIQYPLKNYLQLLSHDQITEEVLQAVTAACSQGQNMIPYSTFQYMLTHPVMRLIHNELLLKLSVNVSGIWKIVFEDYAEFFQKEEISRVHTHRDWWRICCEKHGIPPTYKPPLHSFQCEVKSQFSAFLVEVVLAACVFPMRDGRGKEMWLNAFDVQNVALEEDSKVFETGKSALTQMVKLHKKMLDELEKCNKFAIASLGLILMFPVPPKPWYDGAVGGPQYTRECQIIRPILEFKKVNIMREMTSRLERSQARPVFDALNQLGSTPWRINKDMLSVLCEVFEMSKNPTKKELFETLSVPLHADTVSVPRIQDFIQEGSENEEGVKEKWRAYYAAKRLAEKTKNEHNSLWYWMKYRVVLAKHFQDKVLYFPHNMDFRGRVYPISPYLNHMGDDVNRCILKFAAGRPLGPNGLSWLKLHCINLTGKLKRKSISERLQAAEEEMEAILDSANNPLDGRGWWLESEEPWQTLAACFEIRDAILSGDPESFVSHLAVHQDGSCNGLQHYAALGRDKQGGEEVNLLPSELPNDVYSSVAVRVEQKRVEDENNEQSEFHEVALKLREFLPVVVPRKVIKQTVMTTVYGVTMYGAALQIKRQLKALGIESEEIAKFASYLTLRTFASLNDSFTSSMQLKNWFRECAKGTSELLQTVEWVTPLGLPVVQPYLRSKDSRGKIFLAPVGTKQIGAFPPNFVHSLDSTHMMLTALECSRRGLTFAAVHDCFWTHASTVDEMNTICRNQFVSLHKQPLVKQFSEYAISKYLTPELLSKMEKKDQERYLNLFSLQIQPGELDINDVMKSQYFFS
ncbi:unnamed protein product [Auanema sp. JU1783]|nr:unnamed protein product [Auanema sp. JU1783]